MPSRDARPVEPQYTAEQAAALLSCSTKTIHRRREALEFGKPGTPGCPWNDHGVWKFPASTINRYIARKQGVPA